MMTFRRLWPYLQQLQFRFLLDFFYGRKAKHWIFSSSELKVPRWAYRIVNGPLSLFVEAEEPFCMVTKYFMNMYIFYCLPVVEWPTCSKWVVQREKASYADRECTNQPVHLCSQIRVSNICLQNSWEVWNVTISRKHGLEFWICLTVTPLWANSADDKLTQIFLFFRANRLWHVKVYFLGKIKKYFKMLSTKH